MTSLVESVMLARAEEQSATAPRKAVRFCDCGKKLNRGTRGVQCRSCWESEQRKTRVSVRAKCGCGRLLAWSTRGDLCRTCWEAKTWGKVVSEAA